jgi:hypothetical protein
MGFLLTLRWPSWELILWLLVGRDELASFQETE